MVKTKGIQRRSNIASEIKRQNSDHEKLTITVSADSREWLFEESKRRNKATGARWPFGAIVDGLIAKERANSRVNGSGAADGEFTDDSVRGMRELT